MSWWRTWLIALLRRLHAVLTAWLARLESPTGDRGRSILDEEAPPAHWLAHIRATAPQASFVSRVAPGVEERQGPEEEIPPPPAAWIAHVQAARARAQARTQPVPEGWWRRLMAWAVAPIRRGAGSIARRTVENQVRRPDAAPAGFPTVVGHPIDPAAAEEIPPPPAAWIAHVQAARARAQARTQPVPEGWWRRLWAWVVAPLRRRAGFTVLRPVESQALRPEDVPAAAAGVPTEFKNPGKLAADAPSIHAALTHPVPMAHLQPRTTATRGGEWLHSLAARGVHDGETSAGFPAAEIPASSSSPRRAVVHAADLPAGKASDQPMGTPAGSGQAVVPPSELSHNPSRVPPSRTGWWPRLLTVVPRGPWAADSPEASSQTPTSSGLGNPIPVRVGLLTPEAVGEELPPPPSDWPVQVQASRDRAQVQTLPSPAGGWQRLLRGVAFLVRRWSPQPVATTGPAIHQPVLAGKDGSLPPAPSRQEVTVEAAVSLPPQDGRPQARPTGGDQSLLRPRALDMSEVASSVRLPTALGTEVPQRSPLAPTSAPRMTTISEVVPGGTTASDERPRAAVLVAGPPAAFARRAAGHGIPAMIVTPPPFVVQGTTAPGSVQQTAPTAPRRDPRVAASASDHGQPTHGHRALLASGEITEAIPNRESFPLMAWVQSVVRFLTHGGPLLRTRRTPSPVPSADTGDLPEPAPMPQQGIEHLAHRPFAPQDGPSSPASPSGPWPRTDGEPRGGTRPSVLPQIPALLERPPVGSPSPEESRPLQAPTAPAPTLRQGEAPRVVGSPGNQPRARIREIPSPFTEGQVRQEDDNRLGTVDPQVHRHGSGLVMPVEHHDRASSCGPAVGQATERPAPRPHTRLDDAQITADRRDIGDSDLGHRVAGRWDGETRAMAAAHRQAETPQAHEVQGTAPTVVTPPAFLTRIRAWIRRSFGGQTRPSVGAPVIVPIPGNARATTAATASSTARQILVEERAASPATFSREAWSPEDPARIPAIAGWPQAGWIPHEVADQPRHTAALRQNAVPGTVPARSPWPSLVETVPATAPRDDDALDRSAGAWARPPVASVSGWPQAGWIPHEVADQPPEVAAPQQNPMPGTVPARSPWPSLTEAAPRDDDALDRSAGAWARPAVASVALAAAVQAGVVEPAGPGTLSPATGSIAHPWPSLMDEANDDLDPLGIAGLTVVSDDPGPGGWPWNG